MNGGNGSSSTFVEELTANNYNYWKLCMEAFLQGQVLWDLVSGAETRIPTDIPENAELRRKWKVKCGKALFALRTSIGKEYIDHVRDLKTPSEVWKTLDGLFTKKNTARLQYLENELAGTSLGNSSIAEYFLRVKNLCAEITELDTDEPVSKNRLRRYLVHGLRQQFMSFVSSIQGWPTQPSVIELENLLSNQEALVQQMTNKQPPSQVENVLDFKDRKKKGPSSRRQGMEKEQPKDVSRSYYRCGKPGHIKRFCRAKVTCNRCGKQGHIRANCRVKMHDDEANVVQEWR